MKTQTIRNTTLIAAAVLALGIGTATGVSASSERGERGHVERNHAKRGDMERNEHGGMRERDGMHREDKDDGRNPTAAGTTLPVDEIAAKLKQQGYASVLGIERKAGSYEVKARKDTGEVFELWVDGMTGDVKSSKRDD